MNRETCEHCPLRGTGETCPRWPSDHVRFCQWVDPSHPGHRADGAEIIARIASRRAEFPTLTEQAGNLAGAVARFVASGGKQTTPGEQADRLAVCRGCDRFVDGRCLECGCRLHFKVRSAAEHCPLDPPKW